MRKIYALLAALMLTITAAAQTLNVKVGSVTYLFPASQTGDMTYSDGTTLTIMGKEFTLSEISSMTVDNTTVTEVLSPLPIAAHQLRSPWLVTLRSMSHQLSVVLTLASHKVVTWLKRLPIPYQVPQQTESSTHHVLTRLPSN